MSLLTTVDHLTVGLGRLLSQWENSSVIKGLITSYLEQCNSLEEVFFQILQNRGIYEAEGEQLDVIGALFNVQRDGKIDNQYRAAILQKISTSATDGTTEVFMEVLRTVSGSSFVDFWEHNSGDVHARLGDGFNVNTYPDIQDLVPAGVGLRIYVDDEYDSFVATELITSVFDLDTNGSGVIEVNDGSDDYDLQVQFKEEATLDSQLAELPEIDDDRERSLAELLFSGVTTTSGKIVDDLGNFLVDVSGDNIIWLDYEF